MAMSTSILNTPTIDSYKIAPGTIQINMTLLGHGAHSHVYLANLKGDNVAIKIMHPTHNAEAHLQENQLLQRVSTAGVPNVVNYIGYMNEPNISFSIITTYYPNGSLGALIYEKTFVAPLCMEKRYQILTQLTDTVHYLHQARVVHGDIKADNILLDHDGNIKLCDFGSAWDINAPPTNGFGTMCWLAPEVIMKRDLSMFKITMCETYAEKITEPLTEKIDVFSLAITWLEILLWHLPYLHINSYTQLIEYVLAGKRDEIPATIPPSIAHLIQLGWIGDAKQRATVKNLQDGLKDFMDNTTRMK